MAIFSQLDMAGKLFQAKGKSFFITNFSKNDIFFNSRPKGCMTNNFKLFLRRMNTYCLVRNN